MNGRKPDYIKYIRKKIEILEQELNLIKPLVTAHPPTVGAFYEMILRKFLKDFLPTMYKIGTGFAMDIESNNLSRQIDILIYRTDTFPPIYQNEDFIVVESSRVYSAIEVKGEISKKTIKMSKDNMERFKEVASPGTNWYLIGITTKNREETILRYYKDFLRGCNGLLVLDKYYIEGDKSFSNKTGATPVTEAFLKNFLDHLIRHYPARGPGPTIDEYK